MFICFNFLVSGKRRAIKGPKSEIGIGAQGITFPSYLISWLLRVIISCRQNSWKMVRPIGSLIDENILNGPNAVRLMEQLKTSKMIRTEGDFLQNF